MPTAPTTPSPNLTVEAIVAVASPREYRPHPRDRSVAFTAESAGVRQIFSLALRGGSPTQVTASAKSVSDPRWSPDGRRLAFERDGEIWVIEADGSRLTLVVAKPGGGRMPRWSPDGHRLAFLSRRRGWSQIWLIDAPVPRRGRPANEPKPPRPWVVTATGIDVGAFEWSPDGARMAVMADFRGAVDETSQIAVVELAGGATTVVAGTDSVDVGAHWLSDGSLLFASDADGWFQIVRLTSDRHDRVVLTKGAREHGEPDGSDGTAPLPSPDGDRFVYVEVHDALQDLLIGRLDASSPVKRGRGRPPKTPRTSTAPGDGARINPWEGVWRSVGWSADGAWVLATGQSPTAPEDLWLLPVPGVAPADARPRQVTDSMPAVLRDAMSPSRIPAAQRVVITARDGLRVEGTLWRPNNATGRRSGAKVPTILYPHGGPTGQSFRGFLPFKQVLVAAGFAVFDVDFRGSTGYGRAFRMANQDEWGNADVHDLVDAGRWAMEQPWSDGRLAIYGGSYGGYLVLCALVDEPAMWSAGVDLYGDSEIAESYRHGDRLGRLDLHKMMGSPDDPTRDDVYRRGSPVYRAERIEAPLLILHGRKDKRVVPLMTERMVKALEIEDKRFEVHWYDEEGHGWERLDNRRDAFERTLAFLKLHLFDEPVADQRASR
jgi:dipeptidyl aminopeptidase/acylaminoacyl peptidase